MKKPFLALAVALAFAVGVQAGQDDGGDRGDRNFEFVPGTLVLARSVYVGTPGLLVPGVTVLPPGCVAGNVNVPLIAGGTVSVAVSCVTPAVDATYPNVFNNAAVDDHFGVTSPIFLDNLTTEGHRLDTLAIPTDRIVTSFSSKSELAVHRSTDGKSITFVGYHGGPGFPTGPNIFDVSNGNTPGVIDPTNAAVEQYYRSVAEVDAHGNLEVTDGNAYSGDNGRGAFKGDNGLYYMVGNDNSGTLSKKQVTTTVPGVELINSTGAELLYPGQAPPLPPNINKIGDFEIMQVTNPVTGKPYAADKAGKDNNYRGITIYNDTLYVAKGSGGNGINTVYQVGSAGVLPTGDTAILAAVPITILPGFPATLASGVDSNGNPTPVAYPFGMWFANDSTLYVCDEGDGTLVSPPVNGNVATPDAQATAGIQKWILVSGVWQMAYVLNNGLNIGVPYDIDGYPTALNPATDGCRHITGRVRGDGIVELFATTSTVSNSGDQGADPNLLVRVTDLLWATTPPAGDGGNGWSDLLGHFRVIRAARFGEVFRGVDFAPQDRDDDDSYHWQQ